MHPDRVFYWIFGRFWELATGTALFQFHQTGRLLPTSSQAAAWFVSAARSTKTALQAMTMKSSARRWRTIRMRKRRRDLLTFSSSRIGARPKLGLCPSLAQSRSSGVLHSRSVTAA